MTKLTMSSACFLGLTTALPRTSTPRAQNSKTECTYMINIQVKITLTPLLSDKIQSVTLA